MSKNMQTYESIKNLREKLIFQYQIDENSLNHFHDKVMKYIFHLALEQQVRKIKTPPCEFVWFITGSGGRFEQGYVSDQDHGIIYAEHTKEASHFFSELGKELSYGLYKIGYPYCEGKIMPSNPLWCNSVEGWQHQISLWTEEESWEAIRYLQIFYDSRVLVGSNPLLREIKLHMLANQEVNTKLITRHVENIMFVKKALGPLGQLVGEEKGEYVGSVDLKQTAFLPYVNAIRVLAIKEGLLETSTLDRTEALLKRGYPPDFKDYLEHFKLLLALRNNLYNHTQSYEASHYIPIKSLDKRRKKELRDILKSGYKLHQYVRSIIV
jgi:CBS domain-containing protein